jgi:hypothetical protein
LKNRRLIGFIFAIALGLAAGLFYGWVVAPSPARNATLSSLRADYQTDYVLMVAEAYPQEADIAAAVDKLKELDEKDPLVVVENALMTAQQLGYSQNDIQSLLKLKSCLTTWAGAQ